MSDVELRGNAIEWFSAGRVGFQDRERLVRVWRPGDGLACSAAGYQKRHPCPTPVAVVKDALLKAPGYHDRAMVTRVVCIRHLSAAFGADAVPQQEGATEKAALEELAQRHWGEYQDILAAQREALLRDRLSSLPEELRDQVIAAMAAAEEGGES